MPILITDESYNNLNALYANVGDWVDGELTFSIQFSIGSGNTNKVTYHSLGSNHWLEFDSPTLITQVAAGDTVDLIYTFYSLPPPQQAQTFTVVIDYIDGNKIYIDQPFGVTGFPLFEHADGQKFPADNVTSGLLILADKAPSAVEFEFNLVPNGGFSLDSLIDGEVNGFELQDVDGLGLATPTAMTQLIKKSGGLIKDVTLELIAEPGDGWRDYKVVYKFFQWAILQDGFSEPSYYVSADCVAPISKIKAFAEFGNPNGVQVEKTTNTQGNTGGFDENYNGGASAYSVISMSFLDLLGDPIGAPDYSNEFTFTAIIDAPDQVDPTSTYRMGLIWRPIDSSFYQNIANYNLGQNLFLTAPENDFIADGVLDPTIYQGETNNTLARWDFQNLKFELTGPNELTITGKIIPNSSAQAFYEGIPDGGRKTTIWVSIGNQTFDGTLFSKRVSLKLFDQDNIDAPTKGVQVPDFVNQTLLDHNNENITAVLPQTTTEDDVYYKSDFLLIDDVNYEGIRARIYAYNTVTQDEFNLEDTFFSFASVVNIAGQFQPNFIIPRGFNLPPTSLRNHISLIRKPSLDVAGKYGIELRYGYLSRWEYWLEQSNVDNDFFDITEPNNGKNKNWQRFSDSGNWIIRLSYYTRVDGVDDFNDFEIGIRPYEDEDVTTTVVITLPDGSNPTELVDNEINRIDATLVWNAGTYGDIWGEATIEDFESGNRWVISSVLAQGGISTNPLKPISGSTELSLTLPSLNTALFSFLVDTNIVAANKVSLSYRIKSDDLPAQEYIITELEQALVGFSVRKIASNAIYPDSSPCMRVRRSSDNAELDIGFTGVPLALDQTQLTDFVTKNGVEPNNDGWVVKVYDQSGNGIDCSQSVLIEQQRIVLAGVVDTENGIPTYNANPFVVKSPLNLDFAIEFSSSFTVAKVDTIQTINYVFAALSLRGVFQNGSFAGWGGYGCYDGTTLFSLGSGDLNQHIGYINMKTGTMFASVDDDASTNLGASLTSAHSIEYIGGKKAGSNLYLRGNWQEIIIFDTDIASDKANFKTNINNYYSVF